MLDAFMQIDRHLPKPLCTQVYETIRQAVENGSLKAGEKLPSIRAASAGLNVSRTTVESAYIRLCNEGFAESRPQSGYFVHTPRRVQAPVPPPDPVFPSIRYDFSSGRIDDHAADAALWKKHIRAALNQQQELISYGDPQGENSLRSALAEYTYTARGVSAQQEQLLVGAGTQFLLSLFCSLYPKKTTAAVEYPGFRQAERIFTDYGFRIVYIQPGKDLTEQLETAGAGLYLYIPSHHPKQNVSSVRAQRETLLSWVRAQPGRMILEDDYNGELRYTARAVPAMQSMDRERIVYLGSFSKLLLPSVRIAYMVLPETLLRIYRERMADYSPTAGKIEQLALASYIRNGYLEKHLRRLKNLYDKKSQALYAALSTHLQAAGAISVFDVSLMVAVELHTPYTDEEIRFRTEQAGVRIEAVQNRTMRLSFSGIPQEDIEPAVLALHEALDTPSGRSL